MNFAQPQTLAQVDTSDIDEMLMRGEIDLTTANRMKAERQLQQQQSGVRPGGVDLSKYAGKYQPVKYGVLATQEQKEKAKTEGATKKRSWAVRGILGAYQAGELTDPDQIMKAAIDAKVNDDPQIFELYAAAKQKAQPSVGTQEWLPNQGALAEGLQMYMETPEGQSDQFAGLMLRAAKGEIPKDELYKTLRANPRAMAEFQTRFSKFTGTVTGKPSSPFNPPAGEQERLTAMARQMRGEMPTEETKALQQVRGNLPPVKDEVAGPAEPSVQVPAGIEYGRQLQAKVRAKPEDTEQARVRSLENTKARIMSDATLFQSKIGQEQLKQINSELALYGKKVYAPPTAGGRKSVAQIQLDWGADENNRDKVQMLLDAAPDNDKKTQNQATLQTLIDTGRGWEALSRMTELGMVPAKIRAGISAKIEQQAAMLPGEVTKAYQTGMAGALGAGAAKPEVQKMETQAAMQNFSNRFNPLVQSWGEVPALGKLGGAIKQATVLFGRTFNIGDDQALASAEAEQNANMSNIVRNFMEMKGALSDRDMQLAEKTKFSVRDTPEERIAKFQIFKRAFSKYDVDVSPIDAAIAKMEAEKNRIRGISGSATRTPPLPTPAGTATGRNRRFNPVTNTLE